MYGEKIKKIRKDAGLSQTDCAKITGISQSTVSAAEKAMYPDAEYVAKLCKHLDIPLGAFWSPEGDLAKELGVSEDMIGIVLEINKLPRGWKKYVIDHMISFTMFAKEQPEDMPIALATFRASEEDRQAAAEHYSKIAEKHDHYKPDKK